MNSYEEKNINTAVLYDKIRQIRQKGINKDNYRSKNYEMACTYAKAVELTIRDKENNIDSYYEVDMCPNKNPHLDAYIICTTESHNDYGVQIKSGNHYDSSVKDNISRNIDKYPLIPDNYLLITWNKMKTKHHHSVDDISVQHLLNYVEEKKEEYPEEYQFLESCLDSLIISNKNKTDANWMELNRLQADKLHKNSLEKARQYNLSY